MKGGTIVLMGGAEIRTGAWMVRGTIVSLSPVRLLPTFARCCTYNPDVPAPLRQAPGPARLRAPADPTAGTYERFMGDSAVPGKGELLVWRPANAS